MRKLYISLKIYLIQIIKHIVKHRQKTRIWNLFYYFPQWYQKFNSKSTPLADQCPWLTFSAIDYIKRKLDNNMIIFEFGSGGSTLFFSKVATKVISVEHDKEWHKLVSKVLIEEERNNVEYKLIEADLNLKSDYEVEPSNPFHYYSSEEHCFEKYAKSIEQFTNDYFDIVLVDGRARPSCVFHSIGKIKKGGYLILDNSEREHYLPIQNELTEIHNFTRKDFFGPVPYNGDFSNTTLFIKK